MALKYHAGQIEVQTEANTRPIADKLANWVGPVGEFCRTSDMIVLATPASDGSLRFLAVSGAAPVVEITGPSSVLVRHGEGEIADVEDEASCGGIAINLGVARRARLNGTLSRVAQGLLLTTSEAFTNCRKYVAPSEPLESVRHLGPSLREPVALAASWVAETLAKAETSFLASASPEGVVDVSHRGGPAGFLRWDPAGCLDWDEFVGDGMLKSAGNIRATGRMSLLVPDLATGDALELHGRAEVRVDQRDKRPRTEGLLQHGEEFPVQGKMTCRIEALFHLTSFTHPRRRLEKRARVTSASSTDAQAPQ